MRTRDDPLGDVCKYFEQMEAGRCATRGLPLLARLDGRAFHTWTQGLERPFDRGFNRTMIETTKYLIEDLHALIGYTQSDEITLLWYYPHDSTSEYPFKGKYQKLTSVLAGLASAKFNYEAAGLADAYGKGLAAFDCRVWQVPTKELALDTFIWRQDDAVRNSVSMAAHAHFSAKELFKKGVPEMIRKLEEEKGIVWGEYPSFFKRGTFVRRETIQRTLTEDERMKIPEAKRPAPDLEVTRSTMKELDIWLRKLDKDTALKALFEGGPYEAPRATT